MEKERWGKVGNKSERNSEEELRFIGPCCDHDRLHWVRIISDRRGLRKASPASIISSPFHFDLLSHVTHLSPSISRFPQKTPPPGRCIPRNGTGLSHLPLQTATATGALLLLDGNDISCCVPTYPEHLAHLQIVHVIPLTYQR